jgi:hypothetical protein
VATGHQVQLVVLDDQLEQHFVHPRAVFAPDAGGDDAGFGVVGLDAEPRGRIGVDVEFIESDVVGGDVSWVRERRSFLRRCRSCLS